MIRVDFYDVIGIAFNKIEYSLWSQIVTHNSLSTWKFKIWPPKNIFEH